MLACMYVCMYVRTYVLAQVAMEHANYCPFATNPRLRPMKRPAGQPVRSSCELDAWVTALQAQAVSAAERMSALCEREISCEYLGQRQGPARHGRYYEKPCDWKLASGQPRRYVAVCVSAGLLLALRIWKESSPSRKTKTLGYVASLDPRA